MMYEFLSVYHKIEKLQLMSSNFINLFMNTLLSEFLQKFTRKRGCFTKSLNYTNINLKLNKQHQQSKITTKSFITLKTIMHIYYKFTIVKFIKNPKNFLKKHKK